MRRANYSVGTRGTTGRGVLRNKSQSIVSSDDVSGTGHMSTQEDPCSISTSGSLIYTAALALKSIAVQASAGI
ncbi:unnamed protein product, partial [Dicrocoelium dendriticum]